MAGDVFVYSSDTMTLLDRTRVLGAAGFYNSVLIEDLDTDGKSERFIGGSLGLWRFVLQGE